LQSDWEASSDEEKEKPAPTTAPAAPPKKKGTIKQKIAEKEAERQARRAAGDDEVDYDEDAVLDPRAKAQLEKQRELESDLINTTELFGSATVEGACVKRISSLWYAQSLAWAWACVLRLVRRGSRQDPEIDSQV
jgi:translation initiation factor 3 subunit J